MEQTVQFCISHFIKDFNKLEQCQKREKKIVKSLENTSLKKTKSILHREGKS